VDLKSHVLFIGEIVETYVKADCMTDGKPDAVKIDPLVYAPGTAQYLRLGGIVASAFRIGKDKKDEGE
jgi:flavin reductase (DIM6/NTAB) family NADH-FMN oxidoreductase RutF